MRVLFLSPRQCWPTTTGARLREYHLARQVSHDVELTILAFSEESMTDALPFCHEVIVVPPPERYTAWKLLRGIAARDPVPVLNYTTDAMREALGEVLARRAFDIVQIEGTPMAGYAEMIARSPDPPVVVYNWHNIESELMRRFAAQSSFAKRIYANLTADRLEALEERMLGERAGHIVCSEREKRQLAAIAPGAMIEIVENGVDCESFATSAAQERRDGLVFVGSMNYHANVEAAVDFVRDVWPRMRAEFPALSLKMLGSNPAPQVRALASEPGIEVTGTVPDVRPHYATALAAIVPLKTGGGTRLKILEALAAGVPVISTKAGAEGLELTPGEHLLIAETADEWLEAVRRVSDPTLASALSAAGRTRVRERYDWSVPGARLLAAYRGVIERRAAR
jgi:sugar transferase (PEP-CTERM/EpsH1 system associated)